MEKDLQVFDRKYVVRRQENRECALVICESKFLGKDLLCSEEKREPVIKFDGELDATSIF